MQMEKFKEWTDQEVHDYYRRTHDSTSISEMYNRYSHIVLGICLKYLGNREDAQDITLEVFGEMIDNWKTAEVKNVPAWLHVIARNKSLNHLKKQKRFSLFASQQKTETDYFTEDEISIEDLIQQMGRAIEDLSTQQRSCIEKFYLKKMSYKEIAEATSIAVEDVRSHIQNGRRNLRLLMKKAI